MRKATELDARARDLILGCEIAGLLHDLGKVRPEFAREKMGEVVYGNEVREATGIGDAHGAILEESRVYPPRNEESWLARLREHEGWARVLSLPEAWIEPGTIQSKGLGGPLRQHHVQSIGKFGAENLSLLGDIYTMGADWRDSALDKGSGGIGSSEQRPQQGFVADSFGNESWPYGSRQLESLWPQVRQAVCSTLLAEGAWQAVPKTLAAFLSVIEPLFRQALGETRRPTNDVSLWHHVRSAASLFKAAMAELALQENCRRLQKPGGEMNLERLGRIRFRLLGIRWHWAEMTQGALRPVVLTALAQRRDEAVSALRELLEVRYPLGNLVYEDDDGVVLVTPGFYQGPAPAEERESEERFQTLIVDALQPAILEALAPLGAGIPVRLAWTEPRLYLTDYPEVMTPVAQDLPRERLVQVGEMELQALWARETGERQVQICPQCGLRPALAREMALTEAGLEGQEICGDCLDSSDESARRDRRKTVEVRFGIEPRTFNLQRLREVRGGSNARVVLVSLRVDAEAIADGSVLINQLARPFDHLVWPGKTELQPPADLEKAGELFQNTLNALAAGAGKKKLNQDGDILRLLLGDRYWLTKVDGREEGDLAERSRRLLQGFFLRERIPDDAGLYRHDGDRLALFGQRKHPSPGRLARLWDDLRELWRGILQEMAGHTDGWLMPLSLDARGLRVIVVANDAAACLTIAQKRINARLSRVRTSLPVHLSALAFRDKFPLYIALDALRRMEKRVGNTPAQLWTLAEKQEMDGILHLTWNTSQGRTEWEVPLFTGDPARKDLWYPHVICISRSEGPGRLVHLNDLPIGETIRLVPATFDFMVLEGTGRRYQIRYDPEGFRPHFILGDEGRRPYLLEHMDLVLNLAGQAGWNPSQAKGLLGELVDGYGAWVRDAHPTLRKQGLAAWKTHAEAMLLRYLPRKPSLRELMLTHLEDGLLFDAFEWQGFIEKSLSSPVNNLEEHYQKDIVP